MRTLAFLVCLVVCVPGAQAEVRMAAETQFSIHHETVVKTDAPSLYKLAIQPARWWSSAHSWSGNARNFKLDARAGGCWCEVWKGGSAAHGRVLMVRPPQTLQVAAQFGPLMQMPVQGIFTITLAPAKSGTRLSFDYVVGGPPGLALDKLAVPVDQVIGEQFTRLAGLASGD